MISNLFTGLYDEAVLAKIAFLQKIRLFEGISRRNLIHVVENMQERVYLKGETIFTEGDIGRALFIVFSGKVLLTRRDDEGEEQKIAEVNPGEFFGEMALLEEMPRTTSAVASEETRVFMLFKVKLENVLFSNPKVGVVIASQLARIMSARLRSLMQKK